MGRIKVIFIVTFILAVGLVFAFFLINNPQDIMVDLLFRADRVEVSVGRFSLSFFVAGLVVAFLMCAGLMFLQNLELRAARREIRGLHAQLDKLRELSLKDAA